MRRGTGSFAALLRRLAGLLGFFAVLAAVLWALTACGTRRAVQTVEVPRIKTDTVRLTTLELRTDTILDSVYIDRLTEVRGESIIVTQTKYKAAIRYRDRIVRDTVRAVSKDTVGVPYAVTREVERKLTTWQRIRLALGDAMLATLLAFAALVGWTVWRKFKKG